MAKDEADQKTGTSVMGAGLSVLERAWDVQWALRLACVLLFFDMAMLLHVQRGLSQWSEVGPRLLEDIGWLAVVFVAFSVLAAIVVPVFLFTVRHLGALATYLFERLLSGFLPSGPDAKPDYYAYVRVKDFRDLALEERDGFLYRLYEDDQRRKREQRQSLERLGDLMAAVLVAGFADWLLGASTPGGIGLVGAMESAFGDWMGRVTAVVLLCVLPILKLAWFPSDERNVIYYPPLARKLRDKERKDRGLM
jgi:hypothetical protein